MKLSKENNSSGGSIHQIESHIYSLKMQQSRDNHNIQKDGLS